MVTLRYRRLVSGWHLPLVLALLASSIMPISAAELPSATLATLRAATFEVVMEKPPSRLKYDGPSPEDLMPYQTRTDKYRSIGTAFAIGDNRFVTAAHVFDLGLDSPYGAPALRDAQGRVHPVAQVLKYSLGRDFIEFSVIDKLPAPALPIDREPALDQTVFTVGNAYGEGVVIREGQYTSRTPEPDKGAWQQLRYSAASSPGNSGGPLLDADGKVIGLVQAKSPDGTLNVALPIAEVLDAPDNTARLDRRTLTTVAMLPGEVNPGRVDSHFTLPLTLAEFYRQRQQIMEVYEQKQEAALLAKAGNDTPFQGHGAVLNASAFAGTTPTLLFQPQGGNWTYGKRTVKTTQLRDGAEINFNTIDGKALNPLFLHLRRADNVPADTFYASSRAVGDMLAIGQILTIKVNDQALKPISLGDAENEDAFTDRWQRRWRIWSWAIPIANIRLLVVALPVPDGYAAMRMVVSPANTREAIQQLKQVCDYTQVDYAGTLAQWRDFMRQKALLPSSQTQAHIDWNSERGLEYRLDGVSLSVPPSLLPLQNEDKLYVAFRLFQDGQRVVNGVTEVRLIATSAPARPFIAVRRLSEPVAEADDDYRRFWAQVGDGSPPYDGKLYAKGDVRSATKAVDTSGARYLMRYGVHADSGDIKVEEKLQALQGQVHIAQHS